MTHTKAARKRAANKNQENHAGQGAGDGVRPPLRKSTIVKPAKINYKLNDAELCEILRPHMASNDDNIIDPILLSLQQNDRQHTNILFKLLDERKINAFHLLFTHPKIAPEFRRIHDFHGNTLLHKLLPLISELNNEQTTAIWRSFTPFKL